MERRIQKAIEKIKALLKGDTEALKCVLDIIQWNEILYSVAYDLVWSKQARSIEGMTLHAAMEKADNNLVTAITAASFVSDLLAMGWNVTLYNCRWSDEAIRACQQVAKSRNPDAGKLLKNQ